MMLNFVWARRIRTGRIYFIIAGIFLIFALPAFAKGKGILKQEARAYREQGLKFQEKGNIDAAMGYYQKAIELDPDYVVAYNDLGIVFESKGWPQRAEQMYLQGLKIDPGYLSLYSNLAMLYEKKGQYKKAIFYWKQRKRLGNPTDVWTKKAIKRLEDLAEVFPDLRQELKEEAAADLLKRVIEEKEARKIEAKKILKTAENLYHKEDYKGAKDALKSALSLNPGDGESLELLERVNAKLEQQQRLARIEQMQTKFKEVIALYRSGSLKQAKQALNQMGELISPPPQE
jgi:superkiller protein 3